MSQFRPLVTPGLVILVAALAAGLRDSHLPASPPATGPAESADVATLRRWATRAEDLGPLGRAAPRHRWLQLGRDRATLVRGKYDRLRAGDASGAARFSGLLATEAQLRAASLLEHWSRRIDPATGLLPKGLTDEDRVWDYADAGADLYPHLLIAAALLRPELMPPLQQVLVAERTSTSGFGLPPDIDLRTGELKEADLDDRMYGAVEYAKDGLLPLSERLGPGPWLDRLQELARAVDVEAPQRSRVGLVPSDESEVNGQALQVFARLYWSTGDDRYYAAAERIARAYLELALPSTGWVPARTWDFRRGRSNNDRAQLRDHGNEVVAGLVEFHLIETFRGGPDVALHRKQVRAMLDRLLEIGRTEDGLWKSAIDLDSGKALQETLSDNWGYLFAAYLAQAMIEEHLPGGDAEVARRYRAAAEAGLAAAARRELYPWQGREQDGYADTIESALYLLNRIDAPEAAAWVERQAGTLFGAQHDDGRVEDRYLDGNFVRTALLYAAWQTQGARLEPWTSGTMLGAVRDQGCVWIALATDRGWEGRLVFDAPRHRLHLGLPLNYPRLNEWPEWFAPEPSSSYRLEDQDGTQLAVVTGAELHGGIELRLATGAEQQVRICPAY